MKTHVIQLDSNDDFISIRDKINWAKAPRILIVWPDSGRIRLLEMDIQLIALRADNLGSQLAFVCDDPLILQVCKGLGLPVFSSIPEAQRKPWRRPKIIRRLTFQNLERKPLDFFSELRSETIPKNFELKKWQRILIFSLGILAFIIIPVMFIPSANVQLKPETETQEITIEARANPLITSANLSGSIPADIIFNNVSLSKDGRSSGIIRIPETASVGDVVFKNLTDQAINIPAGVIVRTTVDPIVRFRTDNPITLEPGVDSESVAKVTCLTAGVVGNVSAGEIQAVEGEIGGNVLVTNRIALTGGIDLKTFSPSEGDYASTREALLEEMTEIAYQNFLLNYPDAFLLPRNTLKLVEVTQENRFPEVGNPGDRFKLDMVAEFSIWEIKQSDILPVVDNTISSISVDKNVATERSVKTKILKDPEFDETGTLLLSIEATKELEPFINKYTVFQLISGKEVGQAMLLLNNNLELASKPIIEIIPSFWKRLPFLPFRLNLSIGN